MDGAARRCSGPAGCSQQLHRLGTCFKSVLAGAANNNPAPSSQDRKRRRGHRPMAAPRKLWALDGAGVELLLIDLGTLQAPPAGDSSALTAPAARDC